MKKWLLSILLAASVYFCAPAVHAQSQPWRTDHQLTLYWFTTDKPVTVAWDAGNDYQMGDQFELKIVWLETSQEYTVATTPELSYSIQAPRVGHFEVRVRTVRPSNPEGERYSEWIRSTDPLYALVDTAAKGWIIYWQMVAPGGIIINMKEMYYGKNNNAPGPMEPGERTRPQGIQPVLPASYTRETDG